MKYISIIILASMIMACNQSAPIKNLEGLDIPTINKHLKATPWELTPVDIIKLYYNREPLDNENGTETISISTDGSAVSSTSVTLIHNDLLDDITRGNRVEMELEPRGDQWRVISIKESWKCWKDPEDIYWKTSRCR